MYCFTQRKGNVSTAHTRISPPCGCRGNRHRNAGHGGHSGSPDAAFGEFSGNAAGWPGSFALRLHVEPASLHRSDPGDWGVVLPSEGLEIPQRAFWRTISILVPVGWLLDIIFAQWFFVFPNSKATLGIGAPAFGRPVPVEEYVFYLTGFIAVLLLYVWLGEYWLAAYSAPDYDGEAKKMVRLLHFHPTSLIAAVILIGSAWFYKAHYAPMADREGFPGYFTVLVAGALVPAMSFYPIARRFINWRAFSLTLFVILMISQLWEATLALPYGWWNFQHRQMIGLFIGAWSDLPIEEVVVWVAVTYATTIVFEIVKIWQASGLPVKEAFLGGRQPQSSEREGRG